MVRWKWSFVAVYTIGEDSFRTKRRLEEIRRMRKRGC